MKKTGAVCFVERPPRCNCLTIPQPHGANQMFNLEPYLPFQFFSMLYLTAMLALGAALTR